jgi:hypothetical protein
MRFKALAATAFAVLASGCIVKNGTEPTTTTLYIFANFANPNVTVKVNGQSLGQLTRQYTGSIQDCASLAAVVTPGTMLHTTLHLGTTYEIQWDYGNGMSDADDLPANSDVIETPCPVELIPAPPAVPNR